MKTSCGLVEYAKAQLGLPYWYGTYGNIATESMYNYKKKQYPSNYSATDFPNQYGKRVHDCVGLIKGYCWSETPTSKPVYASNGCPDVSANGMYDKCVIKSTDMSKMPDVEGILVFMSGHVGVYIGGGYVIEARGHAYGVVRTALKNRKWVRWGYCPFITYDNTEPVKSRPTLRKGSVGDAVKELQTILIKAGYPLPKWGADGDFGTETETAVKAFQTANSLEIDGVVGKYTWNALETR